ncbi:hypothetical protein [Teredinibacter turnerae]|uniref:hypothetical protein n=1 Tax=Teredinibacter turnerae TaxID=2426 RepID=UPI0005A1FFE2|nr:hypothetical protein [Teredinibacter turnerae]
MMKYVVLSFTLMCFGCAAQLSPVRVNGVVKDQKTGKPISGIQVSILEIRSSSFMTLPATIKKGSGETNGDGQFIVEGDVTQHFLIELDTGLCWLPYREVYDLEKDQKKFMDIVIYTERISDCSNPD